MAIERGPDKRKLKSRIRCEQFFCRGTGRQPVIDCVAGWQPALRQHLFQRRRELRLSLAAGGGRQSGEEQTQVSHRGGAVVARTPQRQSARFCPMRRMTSRLLTFLFGPTAPNGPADTLLFLSVVTRSVLISTVGAARRPSRSAFGAAPFATTLHDSSDTTALPPELLARPRLQLARQSPPATKIVNVIL